MALQYRGSRVDLQHASLSKELLLVLLPPVVFFARRREVGNRGALRDLLAVASPSLALYVLVRWVWTPHLHVGGTRLGLESLALAAGRLPRSATGLRVEVNGMPLGELGVRPEGSAATLRGPRSILFRGDNRVVLHQGAPAIPGPTLDRITIAPLPYR